MGGWGPGGGGGTSSVLRIQNGNSFVTLVPYDRETVTRNRYLPQQMHLRLIATHAGRMCMFVCMYVCDILDTKTQAHSHMRSSHFQTPDCLLTARQQKRVLVSMPQSAGLHTCAHDRLEPAM